MKSILIALFASTLIMATNSFAQGSTGRVTIASVGVEGGQGVFLGIEPRISLADCGPTSGGSGNTVFIPFSDPAFQSKYSAALTAFAANKNISMWLAGCFTTNWGFNANNMHSIFIEK